MRRGLTGFVFALAVFMGTHLCGAASTPSAQTGKLKAAFIYQMMLYVHWEASDEPLNLGVNKGSPLEEELQKFTGRKIQGRTLRIISIVNDQMPNEPLHAVFCEQKTKICLIEMYSQKMKPLLIQDIESELCSGSIIQFVEKENRLRFVVNHTLARQYNIQLNAKLLELALSVK